MSVVKISVSVDQAELKRARRFVGSRELSRYIGEALRAENQRQELLGFLDELDRRFGKISADHPQARKAKAQWQEFISSSTPGPSRPSPKATLRPARSSAKPSRQKRAS